MRPAAFTGAVAAMTADLDFFIHIPSDPLFNIEIHRQFTHSIIFIPVGALIVSAILYWFVRKHLAYKETYFFSLAGYATAGLMDAITSYGTQLLWPFSDTRIAWNLVSVVDPFLTAGLIVLVGIAVIKKKKMAVVAAWVWLLLFLVVGLVQKERSKHSLEVHALMHGHIPEQMVVKPTIGNQVLWRGNYIFDGRIYASGLRPGIFSGVQLYEGESAELVIIDEDFAAYKGTTLYDDLRRFERLSEGFLVRHPNKPRIIGDGRYAMLPTSLSPLWGVKVDTTDVSKHLPFQYFRDSGEEIRAEFLKMLLG
ncbi:MAG: metal-dependent hydrolase, partial [Balneolaceae bacterium]